MKVYESWLSLYSEAMLSKQICTLYNKWKEQLVDIFIKALNSIQFYILSNKPDIFNIYALTWGSVS